MPGPLEQAIRAVLAHGEGQLASHFFGGAGAGDAAAVVEDLVATSLGARPASCLLAECSVGVVLGLELDDGRRVVLKLHRGDLVGDRMAEVRRVQGHAAASGLPAPRPLAELRPVGDGVAALEEYLDAGAEEDAHQPRVRGAIAAGLAEFVAVCAVLDGVALPRAHDTGAGLWPTPHDFRFDFERSAAGAGWIDELRADALARLEGAGGAPTVVGHWDWRVQNLRTAGDRVVAIFDWDSLALGEEAALVGSTAWSFTASWSPEADTGATDPTPDEMAAFVADYEAARGRPFSAREREVLDAANLASLTYGARCEHSDDVLSATGVDERIRPLLRARGRRFFR